jgi:hypothetical protein
MAALQTVYKSRCACIIADSMVGLEGLTDTAILTFILPIFFIAFYGF